MRFATLWALVAALAFVPLIAAEPAPQRVEKLTDHAYAIFGEGGNVGLFVAADAALLVDGRFEAGAPGLLQAVRTVTDKPVRYLVNTHVHRDHVGANAWMEKQGVTLVAHANVRARLARTQQAGLPAICYGEENPALRARMDLHLGASEFHLLHLAPGHTDGDTIFGYPQELVLAMGDLFFNGALPFIDTQSGGSLDGLVATLDNLATWLPDGTKIIPGHGPVAAKKDLLRLRDFLRALQAHVKAHPDLAPAALAAGFDTAAWADFKPSPGFVSWESLFAGASGKGPGRVPKP
ncbi:MBL fold metallo-hydrolase [Geothrix sp. 21YS21S-2]|uniref:MBL fold metallo-hydrolase n=1 Tax=Geothrix sp. 21YS21S-2 TaxID=3068893 RepID=UPI0027B9B44C|nr:MBL fold metallo-hydrolase [Geothrix sp. 21YS21S-2]